MAPALDFQFGDLHLRQNIDELRETDRGISCKWPIDSQQGQLEKNQI